MAFLLEARHKKSQGFSLESAAEEVLNGIFCHYEPPTSDKAQNKAAQEVRANPTKYVYNKRKKRSILKPSRLFRKKKLQKARNVTWRDEKTREVNLEGKVEAFASDQCDFFGTSSKTESNGLADTLSPENSKVELKTQEKKAPTLKKTEGPPKKILYDDEGNPMNEDGTEYQDENVPPSPANSGVPPPASPHMNRFLCAPAFGTESNKQGSPPPPPPPPPPRRMEPDLKQVRQIPNQDDGMYEPENYDRPPSSKSIEYRRVRSPPVRNSTPRYTSNDYEDDPAETEQDDGLDRLGKMTRSQSLSPASRRRPVEDYEDRRRSDQYYDDRGRRGEKFEDSEDAAPQSPRSPRRGKGWMKRFRRPVTPHRARNENDDMEYELDTDGSHVDRIGRTFRGRSSSREQNRPRPLDQYDQDEEQESSIIDNDYRNPSRSPARRSHISDLTDDFHTTPRGRGPSRTPTRRDDGIEIDLHQGRPRARSRSPSRYYQEDRSAHVSRQSTKDYDINHRHGDNFEGQPTRDYDMDRRGSRDHGADVQTQPTREYDEDRRRSREYADDLDRQPTRDYVDDRRHSRDGLDRRLIRGNDEGIDRRRSRDNDNHRESDLVSKSRDERELLENEGDDREAPRSRKPKRDSNSIEEDNREARYNSRDSVRQEENGDRLKPNRSRRESDPIPTRSRSRRHDDTDDPDKEAYDQRRPHSTTSSSRRGPLPLDTSQEMDDEAPSSRIRDPTPRMSMERGRETEPDKGGEETRHSDPLPPTPRRRDRSDREDKQEKRSRGSRDEDEENRSSRKEEEERRSSRREEEEHRSSRREEGTGRDAGRDTARQPKPHKVQTAEVSDKIARTRRKLMRQLSPRSMATDDEIREEVSSIGMESSTIRPLRYPNPFMQVPPPILEDEEQSNAEGSDQEPSTLSSRPNTASLMSNDSEPSRRKIEKRSSKDQPSRKKNEKSRKEPSGHGDIVKTASSGSSNKSKTSKRSKKLWKGWKKTMGKVKSIVQEIDEKRIPPPVMSGLESKPSTKCQRSD